MSIFITKANICDIRLIKVMAETVFRKTYEPILSTEQVEYMMEWMYSQESLEKQFKEGHVFFIAFSGKIPCGYVSIQKETSEYDNVNVYHIHKLYVMPNIQGNGVGKLLFNRACSHARENASVASIRIELNVNRNNPSLQFYEKMGMHIIKAGDFDIGNGYYMNDYIMGIEL
ncbi:MAG: GNAT family N-acetyltransferase [Bacteroidaceae bacterium]|nr:GNAT family N-acetyltransferase [Bacteroidaceae bacterium]